MSEVAKTHMGVVIVGHVDSGKSTSTGHLLFELGGLSKRELEKLKDEAVKKGKESFTFAYFMDRQEAERDRGITINCTTKEFFTPQYHYTIIDAPGHRDFIKNMISGASQADVAVLMVPAKTGSFEASISRANIKEGVQEGQTRQHCSLCNLLGISQLIVCVNKMDDDTVKYSQKRFDEIQDEIKDMIKKSGYNPKNVPIIPMSGLRGENLTKVSTEMPWYKGFEVKNQAGKRVSGHTLIDALDRVVVPPERELEKPFRMPISGVFKLKGVGDIVTGRIEQGQIKPDTMVRFAPSGVTGKAFTIEMHHKTVDVAGHGDNVGISMKGLEKDNMPKIGDVMYLESDPSPLGEVKEFKAQVIIQQHESEIKCSVDGQGGFSPLVLVRTEKAPCQLLKIDWKKGKSTGGLKIENPTFVKKGDQAVVTFVPMKAFTLDTFENCKGLGRIAVMDSNRLKMLGKVIDVTFKAPLSK